MSKPPEKQFPKETRRELYELGASVVSQWLVAFKTGKEPEPEKLQELGLVFDCRSDGRTWYKYNPNADE